MLNEMCYFIIGGAERVAEGLHRGRGEEYEQKEQR